MTKEVNDKKSILTMANITEFKNYINGKWEGPSGNKYFDQRNPARLSEVTGRFPLSDESDTKRAVEAAQSAFPSWKSLSVHKRAGFLKKALQLMKDRKPEIARVLTLENGKTLVESLVEVDAAYREMDWQINEGLRMFGQTVPSEQDKMFAMVVREPLGVASIISPWNFPFNVPGRKSIPALISGNTCVFKPASLTPQTGHMFAMLLIDAGIPPGVFNMVTGSGGKVGEILISDKRVAAVSFTGSTEIGMHVNIKAAESGIRTQLELGGKNPVVVLKDADLDLAVKATLRAAFACAGQWCTSTSRAIVERPVAEEFTRRVVDGARKLIVGDGMNQETDMGPVCGSGQLKNIMKFIQIGKEEGADLLTGGSQIADKGFEDGCFIEPTVFGNVKPSMTIAQEEIFGPVLSIFTVENFEEALKMANDTRFGLCSSIFTASLKEAMNFIEGTEVGLTHVNAITAYKEPQLPFGGIKESGIGIPEAGNTGIEFFSNRKSVYIKI
jgi:acyl-CoA reductase-like NAD-dependent aldehyde dehydrogenase